MSITIDFCFADSRPLSQLAEEINGWIGCRLAPYQGDHQSYFCRLLGMEFSLTKHDLQNDGELDFENHSFYLGIRTAIPDAGFRPLQLPTMAFVAYALYQRIGLTGILAFDVQVLLARYTERIDPKTNEPSLFDEVSNDFVRFPKHINDLMRQMPENSLSIAWEEPIIKKLESESEHIEIP